MRRNSHRETERKFLIEQEYHEMIKSLEDGHTIRVYYFYTGAAKPEQHIAAGTSVRLTIDDYGAARPCVAKIAIKGPYSADFSFTRPEFEWEIDIKMAEDMIETLPYHGYEKLRKLYKAGEDLWEIDILCVHGKGFIVIAEIEGTTEHQVKSVTLPPWVSAENELRRFTWGDVIDKPLIDLWKSLYQYRMWR